MSFGPPVVSGLAPFSAVATPRALRTIDYSRETTEQKEDQIEQRAGATPTFVWAKHSRKVEVTCTSISRMNDKILEGEKSLSLSASSNTPVRKTRSLRKTRTHLSTPWKRRLLPCLCKPNKSSHLSMCKLYTTADLTLCTASIVNLCVISVDRYLIISRPLRYSAIRTTCRILIYIVVVWLIAALVSLSSHIISNLLDNDGTDSRNCQGQFCQVMRSVRIILRNEVQILFQPIFI
uniref:G_PROTEIN_RECEP_F1_2 domain-containing protein n=1 Tax=Heterorhabditis bacteriophora TaxID=37862 RepID=A0A1I7WKE9_HETBA